MKLNNKTITITVTKNNLDDPILTGTIDGREYRIDYGYCESTRFVQDVFDGCGCDYGIASPTRVNVKVGDTWASIYPAALPEDPKLLPNAIFERLSLLKTELLRLSETYTVSETRDLDQLG
jgi:hypothetical protein